MDVDGGEESRQTTLARKLLNILGEFPVEDNRRDDVSPESKGFQDPLWSVAGLAKRDWDLDEKPGNRKRVRHPATLKATSLSADEARLLRKWTPSALQEIEREQFQYFEHGIFGSKCDVSHALDPIHHGLVTEKRAEELFQAYVGKSRIQSDCL